MDIAEMREVILFIIFTIAFDERKLSFLPVSGRFSERIRFVVGKVRKLWDTRRNVQAAAGWNTADLFKRAFTRLFVLYCA